MAGLLVSTGIPWGGEMVRAGQQSPQAPIPPELKPYVDVRSLVDTPRADLIKAYPELGGVDFAPSQDELPLLLDEVGKGVEAFFQGFLNTASVERIRQEVLQPRAAPRSIARKCNYLMLARRGQKTLALEEYRTDTKGAPLDMGNRYLITSGYASSSLYLHPTYQAGSSFRHIGREAKGRSLQVIAFAQKPETVEMIVTFRPIGGPAVLLVQGLVWIDPRSYQIVRIRTDLLAPRHDILLDKQTTEIELGEVRFEGVARTLWLPRRVVVTIDFQHTVYRNHHSYSDYKLFTVETHENIEVPALPNRNGSTERP
jgi:hypothetical protein